ncbi:MAG TPA: BamA/TamA family outer membrane protein [Anaeromyxobacter sp.]|nr:BamA/TamA family outer membrane protein [Anaeromyxobacter sp.]
MVAILVAAAAGCATGEKRDVPQIHSIRIHGARQVSAKDVKEHIVTTENGWVPFSRKRYFDEDAWKTDLRRIEAYYRSRGFYQARVTGQEVKPRGRREVDLVATVEEGEPTRIGTVDVRGIDDLPRKDRDRLLEQVDLAPGRIFLAGRWEGLKEKLLETLREEGYAAAEVAGEVRVGLDTRVADVDIRVDHGPRYRFGEISVRERKPSRVPPWRVVEQAAAGAKPGDWYTLEGQREAEGRVFRMGVFGAVKVKPGAPEPGTGTVPLEVDVQESRFRTIAVGGGVAFDQTRQEVRATSTYVNRDFLGTLRKLTLDGRAGYAWIPTFYATAASGAKSGFVGSLTAELEQPRFGFRDLRAQTRLVLERGLEPAYAYYGSRARVALVYTPTNRLTVTPSYNLEFYRLQAGSAQLGGSAPALLFGCPENCLLSYAEQLVEWDLRDDRQEPRHGQYLALSLQEGGGILGGSFTYFRVVPEARAYASFLEGDRLTVAARVKVGTLVPAGRNDASSPIVSRFYSGGNDMRGFNTRRLSPQLVEPVSGSTTRGFTVPIGGNGLYEGSFEVRYGVTPSIVIAAFVDTGFVTAERLAASAFRSDIFVAVGAGVRYLTPVGPVRVDLGFRPDIGPPLPVTQPPGSTLSYPTRTGCFGLGHGGPTAGAPEGPCVLHVSIGEAF